MNITLKYDKNNAWLVEEEGNGSTTEKKGFTVALANILVNYGHSDLLRYIGSAHRGVLNSRAHNAKGFVFKTSLEDIVRFAEEGREFHHEVIGSLGVVPEGEQCTVYCDERAIWGLWYLFEKEGCSPSDPITDYEHRVTFLIVDALEAQARVVIAPWLETQ